jgi:acyl-coenzyme A thioesterase 9
VTFRDKIFSPVPNIDQTTSQQRSFEQTSGMKLSRSLLRSRFFSPKQFRFYSNPVENSDGTPQQYHAEKSPIIANLWGQRAAHEQNEAALLRQHKTPTEPIILEKEVSESRHYVVYDFSTNASLRHLYNDASGNILIGKLFEDLDALAGNIAFKHCDDNSPTSQAPNLVTVSVDKIVQSVPLSSKNDLVVFGQIAWVGRSSIDILMKAYYKQDLKGDLSDGMPPFLDSEGSGSLLTCVFTFVARSGRAGHAVEVNRLVPKTPFELAVFKVRENKTQLRKKSAKNDKIQICQKSLAQLVERGSAMLDMPALAHPNAVLMRQTSLENSFICQPQNVNVAGTVFGGFLSESQSSPAP